MKKISFVLGFLLIGTNLAYADEVLITYTNRLDDVDFDGMWSYETEWKPGSLVVVKNDESDFVYRIAHDYENLFVYVSAVSDKTPNKISDRAIVCIDGKNNGGEKPDTDDFCFISYFGTNKIFTLQGGSNFGQNGFYEIVDNHPGLIGIGASSSQYDKYSKIPHNSYEFKIPIEIIGRSNIYGLYIGVFDSNLNKQYGWPQESLNEKYPFIPIPKLWGQMISPDKTLPEFENVIFVFLPAFFAILILRYKNTFTTNKISKFF